jgi:hypothetical protein
MCRIPFHQVSWSLVCWDQKFILTPFSPSDTFFPSQQHADHVAALAQQRADHKAEMDGLQTAHAAEVARLIEDRAQLQDELQVSG